MFKGLDYVLLTFEVKVRRRDATLEDVGVFSLQVVFGASTFGLHVFQF